MSTLRVNLSTTENPFKFINPIRKYKENDPYVSIVDNIPIKQLEENILWLKQAVESATIDIQNQPTEFSREQFAELKPFVEQANQNNIVYVRPGRFNARINDAYNLTPLQVLTRLTFDDVENIQTWDVKSVNDAEVLTVLNKIKSLNASDALGMNGLTERNFVSPFTFTTEAVFDTSLAVIPGATDSEFNPTPFGFTLLETYPVFFTFLWGNGISTPNQTNVPILRSNTPAAKAGRTLYLNESDFVKRWRGIARTAVVDVPAQLSATIEPFNPDDFNYFDSNGNLDTSLSGEADYRIDLVFIYSKAVDQVESYIAEYSDGPVTSQYGNSPSLYSPRKILKAELGIMKGAGVRLSYNNNSQWFFANPQTAINRPEILGSVTDQLNNNLGFLNLGVNGSFPSPDDLMNTAPLLAEWLPKRHFSLVGQSVLPIAYVVVRKESLNAAGNQALNTNDIIDIRPFFRTTELAYNERAGLAAAIPQVSLMNPVATENYVDTQIQKLLSIINNIPTPVVTGTTGGTTTTTVVSLLRDQFNEIYIETPTDKLISTNPVYFGGRYFGLWPNTPVRATIPTTAGVTPINGLTEAGVRQTLQEWAEGRDSIPDGIYKLDKGSFTMANQFIWEQTASGLDQVRWYIFTVKNLPLKFGTIGTETWDILAEPVQALTVNSFVQTARDLSGFPVLFGSDNAGASRVVENTYTKLKSLLPSEWTASTVRGFEKDIKFLLHTFYELRAPHWDYVGLIEGGAFLPGGTVGAASYAVFPQWLTLQDFNGNYKFNNDFKCFGMKYRSASTQPSLPALANTAQAQTGEVNPYELKIKRLYKSPLSSYNNRSVDIRVALLISNRIMVKDIGFKVTNMRVG
jgi:hypothetical protein